MPFQAGIRIISEYPKANNQKVNKMYKPKYFKWYELMPSKEYEPYWLILMDDRILITADEIREYYGRSCYHQ